MNRLNRLERFGDALEACLPLVALAVSAMIGWAMIA